MITIRDYADKEWRHAVDIFNDVVSLARQVQERARDTAVGRGDLRHDFTVFLLSGNAGVNQHFLVVKFYVEYRIRQVRTITTTVRQEGRFLRSGGSFKAVFPPLLAVSHTGGQWRFSLCPLA